MPYMIILMKCALKGRNKSKHEPVSLFRTNFNLIATSTDTVSKADIEPLRRGRLSSFFGRLRTLINL